MANYSGLRAPSISAPSLSVPKLSNVAPKAQYKIPKATEIVPRLFGPGTYIAPTIRRHVENLGDVLLGGPLGTLQLEYTLKDNNLGQYSKIPILNKILGAGLFLKERTVDPILEGDLKVALINGLQSFGQDLDILANPVKSLLPWAGGGSADDFLKSMGWAGGKYRQLYQWNTGSWIVDIAGEIVSDPATWISLGTSMVAKKGAESVADELLQRISITYGADVAEHIPKNKLIALINKHGTDLTNEQIFEFLRNEADTMAAVLKRNLIEIQEVASPEYKQLSELLKSYNAISAGTNDAQFVELLAQMRFSKAYKYYSTIRNVTGLVQDVRKAWSNALYATNPLLGTPIALFKSETVRDFSKSIYNNMLKTRDKVGGGDVIKLRVATIVAEQKGMELFAGAYSNEEWYEPIRKVLAAHNMDYKELTHIYMDLVETLNPVDRMDEALINKRFLDKLINTIPELRRFSKGALLESNSDFLTQMFNAVVQQAKTAKRVLDNSIELEKAVAKELAEDVLGSEQINQTINTVEKNINDIIIDDDKLFEIIDNIEEEYQDTLARYELLKNADISLKDDDEVALIGKRLSELEKDLYKFRKIRDGNINITIGNLPERLELLQELLSEDAMSKIYYELSAIGINKDNLDMIASLYNAYLAGDTKAIKELRNILKITLTDTYTNTKLPYSLYRSSVDEVIKVLYKDEFSFDSVNNEFMQNIYKYRLNKDLLNETINAQREIERQAKYWVDIDKKLTELLNNWQNVINVGADVDNLNSIYYALNQIFTYAGTAEEELPAYFLADLFRKDRLTVLSYADGQLQEYITNINEIKQRIYNWISTAKKSKYKYAPVIVKFLQDINEIIKDIPTGIDYVAHLNRVMERGTLYVSHMTALGRFRQMYIGLTAALSGDSAFKEAFENISKPQGSTRKSMLKIIRLFNEQSGGMTINKPFSRHLANLLSMVDGTNNFQILIANLEYLIDELAREYADILDLNHLQKDYLINILLDTIINHQHVYLMDITPDELINNALSQLYYDPRNPIIKQLQKDAAQLIEEKRLAREITEVFTGEELEERLADVIDEINVKISTFTDKLKEIYRTALQEYYTRQADITFNGSAPLLYTILGAPNRSFNAIFAANELALNYEDLINFCAMHPNDITPEDIENLKDVICMFAQEKVANNFIKDANKFAMINAAVSNVDIALNPITENRFNESINRVMTNIFKEINKMNISYSGAGELAQTWGVNVPTATGKVRRLMHVLNYLTAADANKILTEMSGFTNIRDAMIALGNYGIGVKKVYNAHFATDHLLTTEYLKVSASFTDVIDSVSYYIRRYEKVAKHSSEEYIDVLRKSLIEFYNTYNKDYGPINPQQFFNRISDADILAWHKFSKHRYFDRSGAIKYNEIYEKYKGTLSTRTLKKDYIYNVVALTDALDTALQNGLFTSPDLYEDLLNNLDLTEIGVDLDNIEVSSIVNEAVDIDLARLPKSVRTINKYTTTIQHYIDEDIAARRNIDHAERLILDSTKTVGDYVTDEEVLKELERYHISKDTPINSKTVSTYLKQERLNNFQRFLISLRPAQLRKFMLDNKIPVLIYAYEAAPMDIFSLKPELLEGAGLRIQKVWADENIYMITALKEGELEDYVYTRTPYRIKALQEAYDEALKQNALYYNMADLNIPIEYFTGDMLDVEVYKLIFNDPDIIKAVQKSYSNIEDLDLYRFFEKNSLRPNYVIVGEPQAFNRVINKVGASKTARLKSTGLVQSVKLGTISSIKRVNARNKYLSLIFNDDFSFDGAFKGVFDNATDEEIKEFFGNKRWVAVILRKNRQGNPWIYKIRIYNRASLENAIKEGAVILPAQAYRNAVLSINDKMLTGKWWNLYNRTIAATYKTLYLTTPGFLMRNYLDSAVVKNNIATGGDLNEIWPNFKYEFKAMKMLQEYDKIMAEAIELARKQNGGTKFNRHIIRSVLSKYPTEVQTRFKLVDAFISTPASAGLTRSLSDYLLDYNLKHGTSDSFPFEKWWNDKLASVPVVSIIRDVNDTIEQSSRLGLFLNLLDNGNEYTDAIAKVVNTHFDYELKRGGLELLDQIFWFSTFPINNLLFYLNQDALLTNPIIKLQFDLMEQSYNNNDISWDDVKHSDYLMYNVLAGNWTYKMHTTGDRLVIKTGSSVMDFFNLIANPFGEVKERFNPFLSVLFGIDEPDQLNPAATQLSNANKIISGKSYLPSIYAKLYKQRRGNTVRYNRLKRSSRGSWNPRYRPRRSRPTYIPSNKSLAYRHRYYDKYFNSRPQLYHKFHPKFYTYDPMFKSFYINKQLGRWARQSKKVT